MEQVKVNPVPVSYVNIGFCFYPENIIN